MKKTNMINVSSRLAASIALLASTALAVQASAFATLAGDSDPADIDSMTFQMRQQLDKTNHVTNELLGTIVDYQLADPISIEDFDFDKIGAKFLAAGMIGDVKMWNAASTVIENKGFFEYIEDVKKRMSKLDKTLADTGKSLTAWAMLDEAQREAAIMNNGDTNIIPAFAVMQTAIASFQNFAMAGVLIFAELSYTEAGDQSLLNADTSAKALELAE